MSVKKKDFFRKAESLHFSYQECFALAGDWSIRSAARDGMNKRLCDHVNWPVGFGSGDNLVYNRFTYNSNILLFPILLL